MTQIKPLLGRLTTLRGVIRKSALAMAAAALPVVLHAQSVTLFGSLAGFDVLNDTGQDAHGFEIELRGVPSTFTPYTFNATRYGASSVVPITGGVVVRWAATYDPARQHYSATTITPAVFQPTFGRSCARTNIAGCDHYGVAVGFLGTPTPTSTSYYWLVDDPNNPGTLIRYTGSQVQIPQPTATVIPPPQIGNPPQVVFQIQVAPPPPPPIPKAVPQYGDANWVSVINKVTAVQANFK